MDDITVETEIKGNCTKKDEETKRRNHVSITRVMVTNVTKLLEFELLDQIFDWINGKFIELIANRGTNVHKTSTLNIPEMIIITHKFVSSIDKQMSHFAFYILHSMHGAFCNAIWILSFWSITQFLQMHFVW